MYKDHLKELRDAGSEHFWTTAKNYYLDMFMPEKRKVLVDIGCGNGFSLKGYVGEGHEVWGVDISAEALEASREKNYKTFQADLEKPGALDDLNLTPDVVVAFDFLEHLSTPKVFLSQLSARFPEGTTFILTVPAHKFLYSDWDRELGHKKRYVKAELMEELTSSGWKIERLMYIHFLPLLPAIVSRCVIAPLLKRFRRNPPALKFYTPHPLINMICRMLYKFEFLCVRFRIPLPGLSLFAVAVPEMKND